MSENLNKLYNLINFNPDDVEKDEPPIITRSKKRNDKLDELGSKLKPIFDKLLNVENKIELNSLLLLKNMYVRIKMNSNKIKR